MTEINEQDHGTIITEEASPVECLVMCSVCAGTGKPVSGKPCICGGAGTQEAELQGFREEVFRLNGEVQRWKDVAEDAAVASTKTEACEIVEAALNT